MSGAGATTSSVSAPPRQRRASSAAPLAVDLDDDLFEQGAQQLLAVAVGGGRRRQTRPTSSPRALMAARSSGVRPAGRRCLAAASSASAAATRGKLGLPVAFEPAGDQAVVGVDGEVAPFRRAGLVAGPFDLQAPLGERRVVVGLQLLGRGQGCLEAGRGEAARKAVGDGLVDLHAADAQAGGPAAVDQRRGRRSGSRAWRCGPGSARASCGRTCRRPRALQQRRALADGAAGLVGLGADVGADARLVGLVGLPVDEPGMVVGDEDLPLGCGQVP